MVPNRATHHYKTKKGKVLHQNSKKQIKYWKEELEKDLQCKRYLRRRLTRVWYHHRKDNNRRRVSSILYYLSFLIYCNALDDNFRQSEKNSLSIFLISHSNATTNCILEKTSWLTDSFNAVQSLKSKDTLENGLKVSYVYYLPPYEVAECLLVGMVNGTYQELSTKNNIKSVIERFEQHMPAGMK